MAEFFAPVMQIIAMLLMLVMMVRMLPVLLSTVTSTLRRAVRGAVQETETESREGVRDEIPGTPALPPVYHAPGPCEEYRGKVRRVGFERCGPMQEVASWLAQLVKASRAGCGLTVYHGSEWMKAPGILCERVTVAVDCYKLCQNLGRPECSGDAVREVFSRACVG